MDAVLLESLGVAAVTVAACVARAAASVWPALLRRAGNDYLQQHGQSCVGRSTRSEPAALREWVVSVAVGVRWVVSVEVGDAQASWRCTMREEHQTVRRKASMVRNAFTRDRASPSSCCSCSPSDGWRHLQRHSRPIRRPQTPSPSLLPAQRTLPST